MEHHKLVEGTGHRKWLESNNDKLLTKLQKKSKIPKQEFLEPEKVMSPAQVEKHLKHRYKGADAKRIVDGLTEKPLLEPRLAFNKDGRDALPPPVETDFAEVAKKPKTRKTRKKRKK